MTKKQSILAASILAALTLILAAVTYALAGSFADDSSQSQQTTKSTPEATPTPTAEPSTTPTQEEPAEDDQPVLAEISDPAEAKTVALDQGRPEAAWDRYCTDWDVEDPANGGDGLAYDIATTWLEYHEADCPDAIAHPHYYAQSFQAGQPGEIIVTLEEAAMEDYFVHPNSDMGLQEFGFEVFSATLEDHPELEVVTVTVEGTDRAWTTTPEQYEGGVLTANLL